MCVGPCLLAGVVVVVVSFFIMFFNVQVTNELKGFVFYAQVCGREGGWCR